MPAYMSHYICGLKAFHTLAPGELRECIRSHAGIYDLGLAGPDIFFYSLKETFFGGMRTGRLLHKNRSGAFLMSLIRHADSLEGEERRAALAYAAGEGHSGDIIVLKELPTRISVNTISAVISGNLIRWGF